MPDFEWDNEKAETNRLKHGIGFHDAASALMGPAILLSSSRAGETRFVSVCEWNGRIIAVVWTPRANVIRLISARSARRNEQARYHQSIGRPTPSG